MTDKPGGKTFEQRAAKFVDGARERVAAFATESYALEGRGVVLVRLPDVAPETCHAFVSTDLVYITVTEMRRVTADVQGDTREDADALLRLLDTYDPTRQAVVTVAFETGIERDGLPAVFDRVCVSMTFTLVPPSIVVDVDHRTLLGVQRLPEVRLPVAPRGPFHRGVGRRNVHRER
jgi:hypothetical protein